MEFLSTPYPKVSFKHFLKVMVLIGICVVFILAVFQPFGTASFQHKYKFLLLSGYGFVIIGVGILYFWISNRLIPNHAKDRWTISHEVLFLFANVLCCLIACYFYFIFLFSFHLSLNLFVSFLIIAASVAIVPVGAYLVYIYFQFKETSYLTAQTDHVGNIEEKEMIITLHGTNKNEHIDVLRDDVLFIKSNDNYVIIYLSVDGVLKKKILRNTLRQIEKMTGNVFRKCHRSYLVNLHQVTAIEGNVTNAKLSLRGTDLKIPVSRANVEDFRELYSSV